LPEFRNLLGRAGLTLDRVFGAYDGSAYEEATSPRLIMLGSRGVEDK
jgi:hypothetical protein